MNNVAGSSSGNKRAKSSAVNVYIWDMDETLILLKSLLTGSYAEAFNGSKDVKMGMDIGKTWETHILDVCDEYFFYQQVALVALFCVNCMLSKWTFGFSKFISVNFWSLMGLLFSSAMQIENFNKPNIDALRQYDDGRDLSDYDFNQDGFRFPIDDENKRKLAYRHRVIAHKYKQVMKLFCYYNNFFMLMILYGADVLNTGDQLV